VYGKHLMNLSKQTGMSHVELMIVVALVMIISATALPSVGKMMAHNKVMDVREQMLMDLNFAHNSAVENYRRIVVCPSRNQHTCNASNSWEKGWIVFQDFDGNNQHNEGEPIMRISELNGDVNVTSGQRSYFRFNADGTASDSRGSICICSGGEQSGVGHKLTITREGQVRSSEYMCA